MTVQAQYQIEGRSANAIAASVEAGVESGGLGSGAELPSVRVLAHHLGVSPATVAAAYRALRSRGVVVSAERRGVRVASRPPLLSRQASRVPPGVRDLASGNPDPALLPPLPQVVEGAALKPRLYGEAANLPALLGLARDQLVADGVDAAALGVASGALDGIERVLGVHVRPGDRVAVEDPAYSGVLDLLRASGLEPVGVPVDRHGMDPDRLAGVLANGVETVVATPRAQNPTGAALDTERAAALAGVLDAHPGTLLIEDDHAGPVAGAPYRTMTGGRDRWAVVRSVSKSLGPDLRLAALAGDPVTVARVEARQRLGPGWVSHILQRLVVGIWEDPAVGAALDRARNAYSTRRSALLAALAAQGVVATGASGLNVWVPVAREAPVVAGLERAGWAVQAGEAYRLASPPAIRVTIAALHTADAPRLASDLAAVLRPPPRTSYA